MQGDDDRHERGGVAEAYPCGADAFDQTSATAGPKMANGVERGAVQPDRVRQLVAPHKLGHESPPGGVVDRRRHPEEEGKDVDVVQADGPEQVEQPESRASSPIDTWVAIMSLRLEKRSAITPPCSPNSRIGRNCSPVVTPIAVPLLWLKRSTSQS